LSTAAIFKLVVEGAKHRKGVLVASLIILLIPLFIGTAFVSATYVPAIDNNTANIYMNAANSVTKVKVPYMELIAIDAVRFKQDFSESNLSEATNLANQFVKEVKTSHTTTTTDPKTGNSTSHTTVTITYVLKPLADVETELNMSSDDIASVNNYLQSATAIDGLPSAGNADTPTFITKIKDEAETTYKTYKIYPSITIAQAILESGSGGSELASKYNNLFGIKAYNWSGPTVELETGEGFDSVVFAYFRVYSSWSDSILDHGKFLNDNITYAQHGVFTANSCEQQAQALQEAGYATVQDASGNYIYAQMLLQLINQYNLKQYDAESILVNN
jgi:flagellum-specific peptidoglycan hydrolase FlgJ